ncbi:MAG: NAD-binding protein [bacterium]|nr:NAD-binding protein [bacterium]
MYIILVGGGKVGYHLAKSLAADNHTVVVIEKDEDRCQYIAERLNVLVINGNGCEKRYLREAGIERADVLAAVTGSDEDNLIACQVAQRSFAIRRTVARVNDPLNESSFSQLGIDVPVNSTSIIAKIIAEETTLEDILPLFTFKKGKLAIVRVDLPPTSPVTNKKLRDIKLPKDCVLVSILRGEDLLIPSGDTLLMEGDEVVALTTIENEREAFSILVGKLED